MQINHQQPLVSVIIPTYNRLDYVQQSIDSVLHQTYKKFELYVIDDGSTDGTRKVIPKKYVDNLNYIWQENQGESAARNFGLSLAKGKYIAFLDSDDIWHPEKLDYQVKELEKQSNQEAVAAFGQVVRIDKEGMEIDHKPVGKVEKISDFQLIDFFSGPKIFAPPSNMLIRRKALEQINGFDADIQYGEDKDLLIRLRQLGQFIYINKPLLYYRVHSSSQQGLPALELVEVVIKDRIKILDKNQTLLDKEEQKRLDFFRAMEYEQAAYWCFAQRDYEKSRFYFQKSASIIQIGSRKSKIFPKLGYWGAIGVSKIHNNDPELIDAFLNTELIQYLPSIFEKVLDYSQDDIRMLQANFYHNLIWQPRMQENLKSLFVYFRKSVSYHSRFLLSVKTWLLLIKISIKFGVNIFFQFHN